MVNCFVSLTSILKRNENVTNVIQFINYIVTER